MKKGWKKRAQHQARKALAMSKASLQATQHRLSTSRWPRRRFGYDIVEIFGGSSMISIRAVKGWNLRVLQPVDIRYGVDLLSSFLATLAFEEVGAMEPQTGSGGVSLHTLEYLAAQRELPARPGWFGGTS